MNSPRNTASKLHEKLAGYQLLWHGLCATKATTTHRHQYLHAILHDIALPKPSMDSSVSHRAGPVPGDQPHVLCPMIMTPTSNTTTTNCCYQWLLFLPCPPAKPMPFIPPFANIDTRRRKKKKAQEQKGEKTKREKRRCARPSPNNNSNWYIPKSFQKRPKRQPSRERKEAHTREKGAG